MDFKDFLRDSIHTKKEEGASMELHDRPKQKLEELLAREVECKKEEDKDKYDKLQRFIEQMKKHNSFLKYQKCPSRR